MRFRLNHLDERSVFTLSHLASSLVWIRAHEFFEPWITSKLIEHRIKPKQSRSQRHSCSHCAVVWYRK